MFQCRFFGLEPPRDLEADKERFKNRFHDGAFGSEVVDEDALGDKLQERGDEFNDETFADIGAVGESFVCYYLHVAYSMRRLRQGFRLLVNWFRRWDQAATCATRFAR